MNILTFNYTKANGSTSDRVLAVMTKPNTMYEGIDISDMDMESQALFADKVNDAYTTYLAALEAIKASFDVTHNYRRFDPKKMQAVVSEEV